MIYKHNHNSGKRLIIKYNKIIKNILMNTYDWYIINYYKCKS